VVKPKSHKGHFCHFCGENTFQERSVEDHGTESCAPYFYNRPGPTFEKEFPLIVPLMARNKRLKLSVDGHFLDCKLKIVQWQQKLLWKLSFDFLDNYKD
jgi:hypothetical protein